MNTPNDAGSQAKPAEPLVVDFDDNRLLTALFGEHDRNLARIEQKLGVSLTSRGNRVAISGAKGSRDAACEVLTELYARLESGHDVTDGEIDGAIRMAEAHVGGSLPRDRGNGDAGGITTGKGKRRIMARSPNQAHYIDALSNSELVFGLGPAGTGKTYLAVAVAVTHLLSNQVDRIILSRPAVEAGERLGFLPGDLKEKVDPYLRPLYDALYDMLPGAQVIKRIESGEIEIAPLAFMRGRTLANSFVILDEAQNTTPVQMKMLLTRLGENSRMAVTGDPSQIDLPVGARSGLHDAVTVLQGVEGVTFVHFAHADVVRHPMVTRVLQAYAAKEPALFDTRGRARIPADSSPATAANPSPEPAPVPSAEPAPSPSPEPAPSPPAAPACTATDAPEGKPQVKAQKADRTAKKAAKSGARSGAQGAAQSAALGATKTGSKKRPEIAVITDAGEWRDGLPRAKAICRRAALAAIRKVRADAGAETEICIKLTDDSGIRVLNRDFRDRDEATNVLSFPAADLTDAPAADAEPVLLGDVVVAYETVMAEADRDDKDRADHLAHLVVHGTLHLFGYDHGTDDEAEAMERLEAAILSGIGVSDPYAEPHPH